MPSSVIVLCITPSSTICVYSVLHLMNTLKKEKKNKNGHNLGKLVAIFQLKITSFTDFKNNIL